MADGTTMTRSEPAGSGQRIEAERLKALEWRLIGPFRGGRVVAVAGHPTETQTFYMGSTGGGVWKTTDGGVFWQNVSDGFFKRASVGAIAVAESDPNVIYVGMGETTIRGNVSHGDGVYKSTDGGKTWTHLGLEATRNIGRVRVHPRDPDLVYVAALGHAHGPNPERGVYRSKDGGKTWELVLNRGDRAGAVDLSMDPNNPRVLYASFWEAHRSPWTLNSGGPGSGLWRSTDGGDTWEDLSGKPGMPKGVKGKIGVAASPAQADRVYAIVEAEDGAVVRSDDGGETWQRLCEDRNLRQRAWYYHHIYADPQDPETVWVLNVQTWKSNDGGKTFFAVPVPHGDNHDLWIDPKHTRRMINGNDGGACVTFNGGETWSDIYNQPTAEFYHVTTDMQTPYRVYGAQQDNTTITVPSRATIAAITSRETYDIGGGESGYIAVDPRDSNIVYAGSYQGFLTRYDHRTGQQRNIMVWPEMSAGWGAGDLKYRFQWTFPIALSPHDPDELYVTANHVFRSRDQGLSWEVVSPDLTRADPKTLGPSGGPITRDNTGAEYYATIFAFAESPVRRGVLWAGSDDGLVQVSQDGGANWQNVTPPDLGEWALISIIEPSPHDAGTAYVAANRYKLDDFRPYLFRTSDYGQTWTQITNGIPEDHFTRVIREDPARRGLLYAGTEAGMYVSFDDGANWQPLQMNLPVVPIHDLVVKDSDLVVATHGRSFWILDDLTPLRELTDEVRGAAGYVFAPRPTIRYRTNMGFPQPPSPGRNYRLTGATIVPYRHVPNPDGTGADIFLNAGKNPPDGVVVSYWLSEAPAGEITLTFLDASGQEIKSFTSRPAEPAPPAPGSDPSRTSDATADTLSGEPPEMQAGEGAEGVVEASEPAKTPEEEKREPKVPKAAGMNRFVWNMRYPDPLKVPGDESMRMQGGISGPVAPPGRYTVRLTVNGQTYEQPFEIRRDERTGASDEDLRAQFDLQLRIRDKLSETHQAIGRIRSVRTQAEWWEQRAARGDDAQGSILKQAAKAAKDRLTAIEEELIQTRAKSRQDTLNFPIKLNAKLGGLLNAVGAGDGAPTRQSVELFEDLSRRIDAQLQQLDQATSTEVAALNQAIRDAGVPIIDTDTPKA